MRKKKVFIWNIAFISMNLYRNIKIKIKEVAKKIQPTLLQQVIWFNKTSTKNYMPSYRNKEARSENAGSACQYEYHQNN